MHLNNIANNRPKRIVFVSTKRKGIAAEHIRLKYFVDALSRARYNVYIHYIDYSILKKLSYWSIHLYKTNFIPYLLYKVLKKTDLVIATVPPLHNAIFSYRVCKETNKPLIVDIRDIWEEYALSSRAPIHKFLKKFNLLEKTIREFYNCLNYAHYIITTTEKMKKYYMTKVSKEIIVIPNGTDPDVIKCPGSIQRNIDIVYLGNFNYPYQAVEFLIESLRYSKLKTYIVGDGKYLKKYLGLAKQYGLLNSIITFTGKVNYTSLSDILCRAKVGVVGRPFQPSPEYLYTIPIKVYDYLAAGLPVIGYGPKNSAVEEFICTHSIGVYISKKDPLTMASALANLVNYSDKYRGKARSLALLYDRKRISLKILDIVMKLFTK